ncbi:MAG TPA: recombinase family protein [Thermoplasmata archaeon]|nr:recombinase family protein [Thermoplasmata archaeon]
MLIAFEEELFAVFAGSRSAPGTDVGGGLHISDMLYNGLAMKRAAIYVRISTADQNLGTQFLDVREMARQRSLEIVQEYTDKISGAKARRPGLDQLMRDARRGRFDVLLVWAFDRIARSVVHFLQVLDELNHLGIEFVSFREQIDTGGPLGRAVIVIVSAVAELERSLIVERVRAGLRRARLEGQRLGRPALNLDRAAILRDRQQGQSLGQLAHTYRASRTTIHRVLHEHAQPTTEHVA